MSFSKRLLALVLAMLLCLSAVGCQSDADISWVAKDGDESVPTGVYMLYLLNAYTLAASKLEDQTADVLKTEIEGVQGDQWIQDTAKKEISRYFTTAKKFDEMNLTISEQENTDIETYATQMHTQSGDFLTANGISLESVKFYYINNFKQNTIFMTLYGEGGEKEIPAAEVEAKFRELYNSTKLIIIEKPLAEVAESSGSESDDAEAAEGVVDPVKLAEAKARAQGYYDRAVAGEDFEALIAEWEAADFPDTELGHDHAQAGSHDLLTPIGGGDVPAKYAEVMDKAEVGVPQMFEDDEFFYVAMRNDLMANESLLEDYRIAVLMDLRSDDFRTVVEEWMATVTPEFNEAAIAANTPDKLNLDM